MEQISAARCGLLPDGVEECTEQMAALLRAHGRGAEIVFAAGVYRFSAQNAARRAWHISNSDPAPMRNVSVLLENCEDLTLDFGGGTLLCSGQSIALGLSGCRNVTIKNVSVDWDVPFSAEGVIVEASSDHVAVSIDPSRFPHYVKDGKLWFDGPGWESAYFGAMEFERETGLAREGAGDTFAQVKAAREEDGAVILEGDFRVIPKTGNLLVLRHGKRVHPGLFCQDSAGIRLENVTFHSTCGLGALFQFCRDIAADRVTFEPNRARGREVLSGHDDGLHFSNCSGEISITGCRFYGLMDDAINVHGTSARIAALHGSTLRGQFCHPQSRGFAAWADEGDQIAFLDRDTLNTVFCSRVKRFHLQSDEWFTLELTDEISDGVRVADALENLTHTPCVYCCGNEFDSGRARGMLVTTPRPVRIEKNRFECSGAALLLCGDGNSWYESGACQDVEICGNVFTGHCMSSRYQFCEGVISICPEIRDMAASCGFHRNIRIHDNTFYARGEPLLYAHCAKNVSFTRNTIFGKQDKPYLVSAYAEIKDEENRTIE